MAPLPISRSLARTPAQHAHTTPWLRHPCPKSTLDVTTALQMQLPIHTPLACETAPASEAADLYTPERNWARPLYGCRSSTAVSAPSLVQLQTTTVYDTKHRGPESPSLPRRPEPSSLDNQSRRRASSSSWYALWRIIHRNWPGPRPQEAAAAH